MASLHTSIMLSVAYVLLLLGLVNAVPMPGSLDVTSHLAARSSDYWVADIKRQGTVPFGNNTSSYQIYRNVKDFGATGETSNVHTTIIR